VIKLEERLLPPGSRAPGFFPKLDLVAFPFNTSLWLLPSPFQLPPPTANVPTMAILLLLSLLRRKGDRRRDCQQDYDRELRRECRRQSKRQHRWERRHPHCAAPSPAASIPVVVQPVMQTAAVAQPACYPSAATAPKEFSM
jgi:hypothetical protein